MTNVGDITELKIMAKFIELGYHVLKPYTAACRYDMVIEKQNKFERIQCKTGHQKSNAILFKTCSTRPSGKPESQYSADDIDSIVVYCPDNESFYKVPVEILPKSKMSLRIGEYDKVGRSHWAKDYEI